MSKSCGNMQNWVRDTNLSTPVSTDQKRQSKVKKSAFLVDLRTCLTTAKASSQAVLCPGQCVLLAVGVAAEVTFL